MRIILIDDSQETYLLIKTVLSPKYEFIWAKSLTEGEAVLKGKKIDLVLLDVMLPDGDGFAFCARHQNQRPDVPIVFVTGRTGTSNLVTGLALGAEDYVQKPFDPLELQARVEVKLKKLEKMKSADVLLVKGLLKMNLESRDASIDGATGECLLSLTPLEFKLLSYLARHEERVFSRDQLISNVWGLNVNVTDRTVDKNISTLRQKLSSCADYIETVAGFGYKFSVKTSAQSAESNEMKAVLSPAFAMDRVEELDRLGKHTGTNVLGDMVSMFSSSAPNRIRAMSFALTTRSWLIVEREAHTLKSAAGILGLIQLQERCRDIGSALKVRDFQSLSGLICKADLDLKNGLAELVKYCENGDLRVS